MKPLLAIIVILIPTLGCASYQGYPARYTNTSADLAALAANFSEDKIAMCNATQGRACRDLIVNSILRSIDLQYDAFRRQLFTSSGAMNLMSDVTVLGLAGAGSVLVPPGTKSILAAITGAITGTKASIDKNLFFDKTILVMLDRMEVLRRERLVVIQAGLSTANWAEYTLPAALVDVEAYYSAGTIPAAINSINSQTGAQAAVVEQRVQEMRLHQQVTAAPPPR